MLYTVRMHDVPAAAHRRGVDHPRGLAYAARADSREEEAPLPPHKTPIFVAPPLETTG